MFPILYEQPEAKELFTNDPTCDILGEEMYTVGFTCLDVGALHDCSPAPNSRPVLLAIYSYTLWPFFVIA